MEKYDVIIAGAGPAGMSAAIYAKRAGKKVCILEKFFAGGQMLSLDKIANFPSQTMIDGFTLSKQMSEQIKQLGVEVRNEEIVSCELLGDEKIIKTHKNEYSCRSLIIATGARPKQLEIQNEEKFLGKGLSFCATCDGQFFSGNVVGVVGTLESAIKEIEYLQNICSRVIFITTGQKNSDIKFNDNVSVIWESKIVDIYGEDLLSSVVVGDLKNDTTKEIQVSGLFVALGKKPDTNIFSNEIETDKNGFIKTNERMQTNIKNVFAVGDVRSGTLKQIVTACSDGAIAGTFA